LADKLAIKTPNAQTGAVQNNGKRTGCLWKVFFVRVAVPGKRGACRRHQRTISGREESRRPEDGSRGCRGAGWWGKREK